MASDDDFGGADLPPPPPPPLPAQKPSATGSKPSARLVALGEPPDDPLDGVLWLHRMIVLSAHECAHDPDLTARERRKELRTIALVAERLVPKRRIREAEKKILDENAALEAKRVTRGAKLEARPRRKAAGGASK